MQSATLCWLLRYFNESAFVDSKKERKRQKPIYVRAESAKASGALAGLLLSAKVICRLRRQAHTGTQRNADVHFFEFESFTYLHSFAFSMPADSARLGRPLTSFVLFSSTSI